AENLTLEKASVTAGGKTVALEVLPQRNVAAFRAAEELPAGDVTVAITYQGKLDEKESSGVFRQKERDDWYAFTQLEPIYARRVLPCFDEPDSKVPWQLVLEVP